METAPAAMEAKDGETETTCLPSEAELVLLCLDYLRNVRRSYPPSSLQTMEGLNADYITLACWALKHAFHAPDYLKDNNDAYFTEPRGTQKCLPSYKKTFSNLPSLSEMEQELLYARNPRSDENGNDQDGNILSPTSAAAADGGDGTHSASWYEYNDNHISNSHRFYALAGLASGSTLQGALTLPETVAAGLAGLGARSRLEAERDMIQSPLFQQFLHAVEQKGFFLQDNGKPLDPSQDAHQRKLYEERYRKVVAKFRTKLASKADAELVGDLVAIAAADQMNQRRELRIQQAAAGEEEDFTAAAGGPQPSPSSTATPMPESYVSRNNLFSRMIFGENGNKERESVVPVSPAHNPVDLEEAEKLKMAGNTHMQRKEYQQAADCYTKALKLCPDGPNSHVYFSNRAAAWVSVKQFQQAILDSERSLALCPDYPKAHARLGLAHFLLGNYRQAMEAYTVALKYEPDNKSSKNYLEKAAKRLAEQGKSGDQSQEVQSTSFSVVSEWERSASHKHAHDDERQRIAAERDAEKFKVKGNSYMANREYTKAFSAYSKAIELCPKGANSHVYYSNRAAALCYLEQYEEAERDSMKALELEPVYGKAHARLGLSRFFLKDYEGAVKAYTEALKHDPNNAASKSYLAKAKAKMEAASDAKRLMEDLDFRRAAEKAMSATDKHDLFDDPEMKLYAQRAASDPALMATLYQK